MQLGEQNWRDAGQLTHKVVVMPTGAFEQHGYHLPLLTDSLIGSEIARRAAMELGDEALFLPMLWIGASEHHRAFPGTVSLKNETYVRVLVEMLESLIGSGFRRIFLLNAHGGNIIPGQMAIYDVQLRFHKQMPDLWLAFSSWFEDCRRAVRQNRRLDSEAGYPCLRVGNRNDPANAPGTRQNGRIARHTLRV